MTSDTARLARLRADIVAGSYAPPAEAVAESLVAWIARPEQFERETGAADDVVAGGPGPSDGEGRR